MSETRRLALLLCVIATLGPGRAMQATAREGHDPPLLLSPPDCARGVLPVHLEFRWEKADSGRTAILQLARDSSFTDLVLEDSARSATSVLPEGLLQNDSSYFWRVGFRDSLPEPLFSPHRSFTVAPAAGLSPETMFLGYVSAGNSTVTTAVLRNPTPSPISLDSVSETSGQFRILVTLPAVIDSLDSLILPLRFAPDAFLFFSDSIRLHTTLGDRILLVTGNSPPPLCMVSFAFVRLGTAAHGDSASASVVVYNRGTVNPLHVHRLSHRSKAFQVRKAFPFTVPPQDSVSILLRFVPGAVRPAYFGSFADTLVIDSDGGSVTVDLRADSPPPRLAARPGSLDFGEIAFRDSAIRTIRFTNESVNLLRIDSLRTGRKEFSARPLRGILRSGDSLLLPVRFLPGRYGIHHDTLLVSCSMPPRSYRFPLAGISPPPLLVVDKTTIEFGVIPGGESGRLLLGMSNASVSPLDIDSVTTSTPAFRVENFSSTELMIGDTLRLQIRFAPDTAGFFRDTLAIASNSLTPRVHIVLAGVGRMVPSGDAAAPGSFELYQNFPNPFREMTTFRYALPERCTVRLAVFNSLGQILATIVDGEQEEGYHNVIWRAETASGMYFYKLIAVPTESADRQYVASKRLMVLR